MRARKGVVWILSGLLIAGAAAAQEIRTDQAAERTPPRRATEIPTEGFWPTRLMLERIMDRVTTDLADRYDFDDEQLELTREIMHERVPQWLTENRPEIQTLTNRFFEAQLNGEPPEVDMVTDWARHVQPLVGEFAALMDAVADDMRVFMTDDQQFQLEGELAAFHTGISLVQNKLGVWADGGFDPETEWTPPGSGRRQREREERVRMRAAMNEARQGVLNPGAVEVLPTGSVEPTTSAPAVEPEPLDEWAKYTYAFIKRYDLNHEQKQKSLAILRDALEDRDAYLRGKQDDFDRVSERLEQSRGDEDETARLAALEQFERLTAPVDRRFQQLKDKLDVLPTRAQRKAAAEAEQERRQAGAKPADAESPPATQAAPSTGETDKRP